MILIGRGLDLGKKGTGNRDQGLEARKRRRDLGLKPETEEMICKNVRDWKRKSWSDGSGESDLCGFEGARKGKRSKSKARAMRKRSDQGP